MQQLLAIEVTIETMLVCNVVSLIAIEVTIETMLARNVVSLIAIEVTIETMLVCNVVSLFPFKGKGSPGTSATGFSQSCFFLFYKVPVKKCSVAVIP